MAKRNYNTWSKQDMDAAIQKYNEGTVKFNEVCRMYGIPKPTFRRHLKGLNSHKRIGRPRDLTDEMEKELVRHILELESRFFGLTIKDLRHLAFQLAEKYKLPHRFNKELQLAGWKWYYQFKKTHPQISLRTPEATSMARCRGFNKKVVFEFFDIYEKILDDFKFTPNQIYNVDETGLSTVHKPAKILALKGKHQVGAVTSGERGLNTTCICCMNAAGEFIPPMLIFKRKRMTDELKRGGPPNTFYTCSESGWIVESLFVQWLQHFIKHLKLQKEPHQQQILLILDGHTTHTKNLEAINLAREYGIVMLSLPAHTTHKLQPLDRSFFKPLKSYFNKACAAWMRNNPGNLIKQVNISEILGTAYPQAVSMETAIHGFESCGLWPCNRYKIGNDEYVILEEEEVEETTQNSTESSIKSDIENLSPLRTISAKNSRTNNAKILTESSYKTELENKIRDKKKSKRSVDIEQSSSKK
ncbi:tigger transposable element-derived protein 1-like [Cardiocondyla obscurior]|uniref:tigger transposable element-derived protein 1-like n=1 Tax=Cardiocondyla obscurior TaxID=286306 RepID=UPI003965754D